jgi:membrane-bound serine protease (ClpP class)
MTRYYGNIPGLNRLILKEPSEEEKRAVHYHAQNVGTQAKLTVGLVGIAATALRPSGQAKLDDQFVDVVSNGSFIDKGTEIKIIEIHGNQVVVEEA